MPKKEDIIAQLDIAFEAVFAMQQKHENIYKTRADCREALGFMPSWFEAWFKKHRLAIELILNRENTKSWFTIVEAFGYSEKEWLEEIANFINQYLKENKMDFSQCEKPAIRSLRHYKAGGFTASEWYDKFEENS